jgi:hypothetical protein
MPKDTVLVNFHVDEGKKEEWEDAVDESMEYQNLSHLIRTSVERELSGGHKASESGPEMGRILERLDTLGEIQRQLRDIDGRLRAVEDEVKHDPERTELAGELFRILPEETSDDDVEYQPGDGHYYVPMSKSLETGEYEQYPLDEVSESELLRTGRIEAFAHVLGEDPYKVERAMEQLQEDTYQVQETDDGRYHRRENR